MRRHGDDAREDEGGDRREEDALRRRPREQFRDHDCGTGIVIVNCVPRPGADLHCRSPPWARTMRLTIARPRPRPPKRRVADASPCAKSSKMASRRSGWMPTPESMTDNCTTSPLPLLDVVAVRSTWPPD